MSHYPVYLIESLGAPRNHHALFVQTSEDETGSLFNVTGNIQSGMELEIKELSEKPKLSQTFLSKSQLGWMKADDLHRVEEICRSNPPPAKQFDGPKRIDKTKPLRRCQEWTSETVASLRAEGILQ
ncbi:Ff.00g035770.m01.CDS01 [Fusarium sp. VM40]|nr:Ff.00g035770.m01.CDS01 [Fusarium sp. VM40]